MIGGLQYTQFLEHHADQIIFISKQKIIYFDSWVAFSQAEDYDVQSLLNI